MLILGIACAAAVVASLVVTPVVVRAAVARGLYDVPADARRVHTRPTPRLGGVAVFTAMVLGLAAAVLSGVAGSQMWTGQPNFLAGILLGGGVVFVAGLWDDVRGLPPVAKLAAQSLAAVIAFALGFRVEALSLGTSVDFPLGWFSLPLTILWVVGVTNAFNLIDGLDGLATGVALVALSTTLVVAIVLGNVEVVVVCLALIGALLGFLRYNFSPARIFLGDSGSLFVGFMLAVLSVYGSLKSATAVLVLVPLFALALPLLDTGLAIARRWLRGMPLSGADARHIHHQLLALGFSQRGAVIVLYVAAIALSVLGLSLAFAPPASVMITAIAGGLICGLILLYGTRHLDYHEFAEAGAVLVSGVLRARRVIREQIHARDVAQLIKRAETLDQVDRVLEQNVARFGLLAMEVCREMSPGRRRAALMSGSDARVWKLEYPVMPRSCADDNPYVFRIWCGFGNSYRPYGAERVARILAPTIESWLAQRNPATLASEMADAAGPLALSTRGPDEAVDAVLGWAKSARGPSAAPVLRPVGAAAGRRRALLRRDA